MFEWNENIHEMDEKWSVWRICVKFVINIDEPRRSFDEDFKEIFVKIRRKKVNVYEARLKGILID